MYHLAIICYLSRRSLLNERKRRTFVLKRSILKRWETQWSFGTKINRESIPLTSGKCQPCWNVGNVSIKCAKWINDYGYLEHLPLNDGKTNSIYSCPSCHKTCNPFHNEWMWNSTDKVTNKVFPSQLTTDNFRSFLKLFLVLSIWSGYMRELSGVSNVRITEGPEIK